MTFLGRGSAQVYGQASQVKLKNKELQGYASEAAPRCCALGDNGSGIATSCFNMLDSRPMTCLAAEVTRGDNGSDTSAPLALIWAASPSSDLVLSEASGLAAVLMRRNTCTRAPSMSSSGNRSSSYCRR